MAISLNIGFEIVDNGFRLVETESIGHILTVLSAEHFPVSSDFSTSRLLDVPFRRDDAKAFIDRLAAALGAAPRAARRVSICLPATVPLITMLPIDRDLDEKEKVEQIEWDCRTLMGMPSGASVAFHTSKFAKGATTEDRLVVALPDSLIRFLHETFRLLGFTVASIRISHFIMEDWLEKRFAVEAHDARCIVGVFETHAIAGIYRQSGYSGLRMIRMSKKHAYTPQIIALIRDAAGTAGMHSLNALYLYGSHAGGDLPAVLSGALSIPAHPVASYLTPAFKRPGDGDAFQAAPHQFETALCAALGSMS